MIRNVTKHRVTCEEPVCGRVWRENCADCAQDAADRHRRETGHPVGLQISDPEPGWKRLQEMTGLAHPVLLRTNRNENENAPRQRFPDDLA
jgi:hypothetical protein